MKLEFNIRRDALVNHWLARHEYYWVSLRKWSSKWMWATFAFLYTKHISKHGRFGKSFKSLIIRFNRNTKAVHQMVPAERERGGERDYARRENILHTFQMCTDECLLHFFSLNFVQLFQWNGMQYLIWNNKKKKPPKCIQSLDMCFKYGTSIVVSVVPVFSSTKSRLVTSGSPCTSSKNLSIEKLNLHRMFAKKLID